METIGLLLVLLLLMLIAAAAIRIAFTIGEVIDRSVLALRILVVPAAWYVVVLTSVMFLVGYANVHQIMDVSRPWMLISIPVVLLCPGVNKASTALGFMTLVVSVFVIHLAVR